LARRPPAADLRALYRRWDGRAQAGGSFGARTWREPRQRV